MHRSLPMAGLLRDRYFEYAPERAWDLVTGENVSAANASMPDLASGPAPGPLIELLDHGTEGSPRRFVLEAPAFHWRTCARLVAVEARRRGYVAMALDVFLRLRTLLAGDLCTRAIVLIARPNVSTDLVRAALLHAAAISSGAHVVVTPAPRGGRLTQGWRAAEARAAYSSDRPRAGARAIFADDVRQLLDRATRSNDLVHRGRHASAERLLREAASALVRRQAPGPAAEVYLRLGRLLLERGNVSSADAAFAEAAVLAEGCDSRLVVSARLCQAAARTDGGQLTAAESLCRAVLVTNPTDEERALAEATLGRVLLWQGRVSEAIALPFVHRSSSAPYVAATAVRLLLESGDLFQAGRRARELLDATVNGDPLAVVVARGAHLRVLLAAGDLTLATEALRSLATAARAARTPLRFARMRLLWSQALRRAGNSHAADRELRALSRLRSAMPPLLRSAIDRALKPPRRVPVTGSEPVRDAGGYAEALVVMAQREEDDSTSLTKLLDFVLRTVRASRVELWSADAGPATTVVSCGAGLPTHLGPRALEAGTVVGPEVVESGWEVAVPVRLGSQLLAVLAARWPADSSRTQESLGVLKLACAVAAPRVESLTTTARQTAAAATAIPELVGVSAAMGDVRRAVTRAAAAPFSVLIEGAMRR